MGKTYSASDPICDVAGSNYVGVFGIGEPGVDGNGIFYRGSFTRIVDITDGLTNTLCVGERSTNLNLGVARASTQLIGVDILEGRQLFMFPPAEDFTYVPRTDPVI